VKKLKQLHPDREFSFLTGMDSLTDYPWRDLPGLLANLETLWAASRPNYAFATLLDKVGALEHLERIKELRVPYHEVSSSQIRERLSLGRSAQFWVPDEILEYINLHGLYRQGEA